MVRETPAEDDQDDLEIVDAHQHFWDLERNDIPWLRDEPQIPFRYGDYDLIRRSYLPADYRRDAVNQRIVQSVYVETEWHPSAPLDETRWAHEVSAATSLPNAVVAQARLERADVQAVLEGHAAFPLTRGIRQKPRAAGSPGEAKRNRPGSMDDEQWRRGYAILERHRFSFDLQVPWWHLDEAHDLAVDFPGTTIVLNHTGLPADRSREGLAGWRTALEHLARAENVALKISGLGQPGRPWTVRDNGPVIRDALSIFGTGRCMFASNYPIDRLCAGFDTIWQGFKTVTSDLGPHTRGMLFAGNARRIYRIGAQPPSVWSA